MPAANERNSMFPSNDVEIMVKTIVLSRTKF